MTAYKTSDAAARGIDPVLQVNLKGCEVTPEVNLSQNRYQIKLEIPSAEGMSEMWLRFDTVSTIIGHNNRDHATSVKRGRLERFTTLLSKPDLDRLLNKALQAPSVGGCLIPITVPY